MSRETGRRSGVQTTIDITVAEVEVAQVAAPKRAVDKGVEGQL